MTHRQHDPGGAQGIPLSAVYRQLDDHRAPEAAEYDPAAAVARLMTRWAADDLAARPGEPAPDGVHQATVQMVTIRRDLVLQLARRRFAGSVTAYAAILGTGGIAAAAVFISRLAAPVLAGIGTVAILAVVAVVVVHQITMRSISEDHDRILGENTLATVTGEERPPITRPAAMQPAGYPRPDTRPALLAAQDDEDDEEDDDDDDDGGYDRPKSRGLRFRPPWQSAAAAFIAIVAAVHDGTGGIVLLAVTLGVLSLAALSLIATALFGSRSVSDRAFRLLRRQYGSEGNAGVVVRSRAAGRDRAAMADSPDSQIC
jgi:hypothetical protein